MIRSIAAAVRQQRPQSGAQKAAQLADYSSNRIGSILLPRTFRSGISVARKSMVSNGFLGGLTDYTKRKSLNDMLFCRNLSAQAQTEPHIEPPVKDMVSDGNRTGDVRHIDTYELVRLLQLAGYSSQQSEALVQVVTDAISEATHALRANAVSMEEQERNRHSQKLTLAKLRNEITAAQRKDLQNLRKLVDQQISDLEKLSSHMKSDLSKSMADVQLDLNLEKARARDEISAQEVKIKATDARIDTEISNLKAYLSQSRQSTWQYMGGLLITISGLYFAYLRFIS